MPFCKKRESTIQTSDSKVPNRILKDSKDKNKLLEEKIEIIINKKLPLNYHKSCYSKFLQMQEKVYNSFTSVRHMHSLAWEKLCEVIEDDVIAGGQCFYLSLLENVYYEVGKTQSMKLNIEIDQRVFTKNVKEKVLNKYKKYVSFKKVDKKLVIVPKGIKLPENTLLPPVNEILWEAAKIIREECRDVTKTPFLDDNVDVKKLTEGECAALPLRVIKFFKKLLSGPISRRLKSKKTIRIAKSLTQDLVYNVNNGTILTEKHVTLGLSIKSLTNSRKCIEILNRYGQTCSYSKLEEIQTAAANFINSQKKNVPPGYSSRT